MPVSTDGVLLGAWAQLGENFHLLDIGTGTGLLALMCAQRQTDLTIEAIDIEETAIKSATRNIESSPWKNRIQMGVDLLERQEIFLNQSVRGSENAKEASLW